MSCVGICVGNADFFLFYKNIQRIWRESNPRHTVPETVALSPELQMPATTRSYYHTSERKSKGSLRFFHHI